MISVAKLNRQDCWANLIRANTTQELKICLVSWSEHIFIVSVKRMHEAFGQELQRAYVW